METHISKVLGGMDMKLAKKMRFIIKCMSYSLYIKNYLIGIVSMLVLGLTEEIADLNNGIGAYMILISAMYPAQMLYSVCSSQLVQVSPYKKVLTTSMVTLLTFCSSLVFYLLVIGVKSVWIILDPSQVGRRAGEILAAGLFLVVFNIYIAVAQKYFWGAMIILSVAMICIYGSIVSLGGFFYNLVQLFSRCPFPAAIAIGLCLVLLGSVLQYGVSLLLYSKPISKRAVYGILRQQS